MSRLFALEHWLAYECGHLLYVIPVAKNLEIFFFLEVLQLVNYTDKWRRSFTYFTSVQEVSK